MLPTSPVGTELLDDPAADPALVASSLRHIVRANRWFGGRAAAVWGVRRLLAGAAPRAGLTLLDIGTGTGDLPAAIGRSLASRGIAVKAIGLERSPVAARLARGGGLATILGCAGALPVRPRGVDIVLMSQVVHHLASDAVVELFRAVTALARVGVVVADLRRSEAAVVAFRVGSAALRFDAVTRADGITSLRRGYTAVELLALARRAGAQASVARRPGFRLVATWRSS